MRRQPMTGFYVEWKNFESLVWTTTWKSCC